MKRRTVVLAASLTLACLAPDLHAQDMRPRARLISIPTDSVPFMVGGRIVELGTWRPVPGAQVWVRGASLGTLTDGLGQFRLDATAAGPVEVRFRLFGLDSACINVNLRADAMQSLLIAVPPRWTGNREPTVWPCRDPETVDPPR